MTYIPPLTIDPQGQWSAVQVRKVLEIINPQAALQGIQFRAIDVTTFNMPTARYLLQAYCKRHQEPVPDDDVCWLCLQENK